MSNAEILSIVLGCFLASSEYLGNTDKFKSNSNFQIFIQALKAISSLFKRPSA